MMNQKTFSRYLARDKGCLHCGEVETAIPHHRLNRGMGGSKERDVPSNIIVLCSFYNGLIEAEAFAADRAREMGWKLRSGQNPMTRPVWIPRLASWVLLDNEYKMKIIETAKAVPDSPPMF